MKFPFCDLKLVPKSLIYQWEAAISDVISGGIYVSGVQKKMFESRFATMVNSLFALGVSNGLDGLVLALKALGANKETLVAVPEHTFIATYNAVEIVGSAIIPVKVGSDGLMDLNHLESLNRTPDIVIPVHMHGGLVDMHRLIGWARSHGIKVIEDASQAHLAKIGSRYAGTFSDIGVFSLYPTKNIGAIGDAGVVVTDNSDLIQFMNTIANYGSSKDSKYVHEFLGINARLDEVQAAILNINLDFAHAWNAHRSQLAKIYESKFENSNLIFLKQNFSVYHHFIVFPKNRDSMMNNLKTCGIGTEIHYPIPAIDEYSRIKGITEFMPSDNATKLSRNGLSLPLHHWMKAESIEYIADRVLEFNS